MLDMETEIISKDTKSLLQQKKYNILFDQRPSVIRNNHLRCYFGNFYNPGNLLDCLERIVLKKWYFKNHDYVYSKEFGHYINLHLKARFKTQELKLWSSGPLVEKLQKALGIKVDGKFGEGTELAVKKYQKKNGLTPDGVVGPETWKKLT